MRIEYLPRRVGDVVELTRTFKSGWTLTRERKELRIVAASTPSRVFLIALLRPEEEAPMDVVITRCAGLDVHQPTVVATVRMPDDQGDRRVVTDTFGTMTTDLLALRDWLQAYG
jgi:hypothetical protein